MSEKKISKKYESEKSFLKYENHYVMVSLTVLGYVSYIILLLLSITIFWKGPMQQAMQNETRFVNEYVNVEGDIYPLFTICKVRGFKTEYTNNYYAEEAHKKVQKIKNTKGYKGNKTMDIMSLKNKTTQICRENLLEVTDIIDWSEFLRNIDRHEYFPLNSSYWKPVPSDSRFTGNCFSIDSSIVKDDFGAKSDMILQGNKDPG